MWNSICSLSNVQTSRLNLADGDCTWGSLSAKQLADQMNGELTPNNA